MKRTLLLFTFILAAIVAFADSVTEQQAYAIALEFAKTHNMNVKAKRPRLVARQSEAQQQPKQSAYYVFNIGNSGDGFVIVSGDDRTEPVLGYSTTGYFDADNISDGLKYMLETYAENINKLDNSVEKKNISKAKRKAIEPLIKTHWNQTAPYNLLCPESDGKRTVTGCVATAMAQILYYFRCPAGQTTEIPSYTTSNYKEYPALPATTFDWDKMKTDYASTDSDASAMAVAKLMQYCGYAAEMNYGVDQSSAKTPKTQFNDYFGFSRLTKYRSYDRTQEEWTNVIYKELEAKRPVLYAGYKRAGTWSTTGHEFICDGYDGNGYYHINWGWGGSDDGYYILSNISYNNNQEMVYNFIPSTQEDLTKISFYISYEHGINNKDTATITRENANSKFKGGELLFGIGNNYVNNFNQYDFIESGALGLYQNGELKKIVSEVDADKDHRNEFSFSELDLTGVEDGDYQLKILLKIKGNNAYTPCDNSDFRYFEATLKGDSLKLKEVDNTYEESTFTISDAVISGGTGTNGKFRPGDDMTIKFKLKNDGNVIYPNLHIFMGNEHYKDQKVYAEANAVTDITITMPITSIKDKEVTISYNGDILYTTPIECESNPEASLNGNIHYGKWKTEADGSHSITCTIDIMNRLYTEFDNNITIEYYGIINQGIGPETFVKKRLKLAGNDTQTFTLDIKNLDKIATELYMYINYPSENNDIQMWLASVKVDGDTRNSWLAVDKVQDLGIKANVPETIEIPLVNKTDKDYEGNISADIISKEGTADYNNFSDVKIPANGKYILKLNPYTEKEWGDGDYSVRIQYDNQDNEDMENAPDFFYIYNAAKFTIDKSTDITLSGSLSAGEWVDDATNGLSLPLTLVITNGTSYAYNDSLNIEIYPVKGNTIYWEKGEGDAIVVSIPANESITLTPMMTELDKTMTSYQIDTYYKGGGVWKHLTTETFRIPDAITGIKSIEKDDNSMTVKVYDITGRYIGSMPKNELPARLIKGMYVVDGKKVIIR